MNGIIAILTLLIALIYTSNRRLSKEIKYVKNRNEDLNSRVIDSDKKINTLQNKLDKMIKKYG